MKGHRDEREIKFRAWEIPTKQWIFEGKLKDIITLGKTFFDKEVVWIEFTGLKDKNSKEIYEGDIVKGYSSKNGGGFVDDVIGVMKYEGLVFAVQGKHINDKEKWFYTMTSPKEQDNYIEVIGNIYESKHLLDNEKERTQR